jgi:hypothetical protein
MRKVIDFRGSPAPWQLGIRKAAIGYAVTLEGRVLARTPTRKAAEFLHTAADCLANTWEHDPSLLKMLRHGLENGPRVRRRVLRFPSLK